MRTTSIKSTIMTESYRDTARPRRKKVLSAINEVIGKKEML
jgi:hypothetical protein